MLGNDTPGPDADAVGITPHQELDWTAGDAAWRFNGTSSVILLGDVLNFERTDPVTFSVWVEAEDFSQHDPAFAILFRRARATDSRGWAWGIEPNTGQVRLHIGVGGSANSLVIDSASGIQVGKRVHIVTTYNGGSLPASMEHYFDGVLQGKTTITNGLTLPIAGTGSATISFSSASWKGSLQHMSVWNAALTQAQVTELNNGGTPGNLLAHSAVANLRGWWKIEGSPDTTVLGGVSDSSGNGIVGSAFGGLGGRNWELDGLNDSVTYGDVLSKERTDSYTISAWVSVAGLPNVLPRIWQRARLSDGNATFLAAVQSTGRLYFQLGITGNVLAVTTSTAIPAGLVHVVSTYDGTNAPAGIQLYFNGAVQAKVTVTNTLTLDIAGTPGEAATSSGNRPWQGTIQHLSIWDGDLTALEVAALYNNGLPPDLNALSLGSNLEAWWVFDEDDTTAPNGITDRSGNGLHGTAQNGYAPKPYIVPNSLLTRGAEKWRFLLPGSTINRPLVSSGPALSPGYATAPLTAAQFEQLPANSVIVNALGSAGQYQVLQVPTNSIVAMFAGFAGAGPATNVHFAAAAAIALSKLQTMQANSVLANPDPLNPLSPVDFPVPANSVLGLVGGVMVAAPIVAAQIADTTLIYQKLAVQTAVAPFSGGGVFTIRLQFAVVAGVNVDTTILTLPAGIGVRILDVILRVTTAVAASTVRLFNAAGAPAGGPLSSLLSSAATGVVRNNDSVTRTQAGAGLIVMRRTAGGVAGTITIKCCRN